MAGLPEPGGWNRFVLQVTDLAGLVATLRAQGVAFRNDIVDGPGGRQILCEDPSGNVVELFEAARRRRSAAHSDAARPRCSSSDRRRQCALDRRAISCSSARIDAPSAHVEEDPNPAGGRRTCRSAASVHRDECHVCSPSQFDGDIEILHHRHRSCRQRHGWQTPSDHRSCRAQVDQPRHAELAKLALSSAAGRQSIASSWLRAKYVGLAMHGNDPVMRPLLADTRKILRPTGSRIDVDQPDGSEMRAAGLEPARPMGQGVLSALCLPVPSRPRAAILAQPARSHCGHQARAPTLSIDRRSD